MRSKQWCMAVIVLACACELDKTAIPRTDPQLALHGVLSASAGSQVVLLERTRSGRVQLVAPSFDLEDPIGSDEGIAETGALMTLLAPDGTVFVATEDNAGANGKGRGVYRFALPGSALQRNAIYHLSVATSAGEQLSAETSVPDGVAAMTPTLGGIDRTHDTLKLSWPASPGASSYLVRIETPYGPRAFFTESTHVQLPGMLRNADVDELPHVFFPGFDQAVTISAVDSNYYDWYRTHDDPLSGEGLINRVEGGLGVFGSLVRLRFDSVQVMEPRSGPVEGLYELDSSLLGSLGSRYLNFDIYIESPAARSGQSDALSGRYLVRPRLDYSGCPICGLLGTARNGQIELALLDNWSGADTVEVFDGTVKNDTIVGSFRFGGGPFRFVRR
ncbi:MAG TPA: hypothetical protein VH539_18870 [Gemmatimonadaceae bacterium]